MTTEITRKQAVLLSVLGVVLVVVLFVQLLIRPLMTKASGSKGTAGGSEPAVFRPVAAKSEL